MAFGHLGVIPAITSTQLHDTRCIMAKIGRHSRRRTFLSSVLERYTCFDSYGLGPSCRRHIHTLCTPFYKPFMCQALEPLPCQRKAGLSPVDRAGLSGRSPRVPVYKSCWRVMLAEVTGRIGSEVERGPSDWLNCLFSALHCMIPKAPGCCFLFGCFSLLAKKRQWWLGFGFSFLVLMMRHDIKQWGIGYV